MAEIKVFAPSDVPAVANLFMKVFRKNRGPSPDSLKAYFNELYLDSSWQSDGAVSYIARLPDGTVTGFIGALPLRLNFRGEQITAAVAGNHMVDPEHREAFTGINLLKRLLDGPQHLTLTDTANEISRRLWEQVGARLLMTHSLRWLRILRPASYPLSLVRNPALGPAIRILLSPLTLPGDRLGRRFVPGTAFEGARDLTIRELDPSTMVSSFPELVGTLPLRPAYDKRRLEWIIRMAGDKRQYGPFGSKAVFDKDRLLGWYLYYARRHQTAQVLQVVARHDSVRRVLNSLFLHLFDAGCIAATGMLDPRYLREFHEQKCIIFLRDMYTMAHTRDKELLQQLLSGQAFISRLEGEWWTRLQGDTFD
jgi:hypothetical protein